MISLNAVEAEWGKTEFIIFGTHQQLKKIQNITIRIGSTNIIPADHFRNLGFMMDMFCKNTRHINHLSSSLCQQLRNIWKIRGKLDFDTAKIVVQALILSKLDYCNSLLVEHLGAIYLGFNICRIWPVEWFVTSGNMTTCLLQCIHYTG